MNRMRVIAATAVAPILWGTTYVVTTEMLPADRPLLSATLRALPAGLALLLFTRALPRGHWWWRAAVLGTLNIGAFFAFLFVSAYRLPGGVSATLGAVQPLIVAALAAFVIHEAMKRRTIVAAIGGLAGVALLVLSPGAALDTVGVIAGLLGGVSAAFGVVLTKRWDRPVSLLAFTSWQLVAGGLVLSVPALLIEGPPPSLSALNLAGYAWLAIPGTMLAHSLWFRGILALPATQASVLGFLAPLTAAILGWVLLDQILSPWQLAGAVVIVLSVLLGQGAFTRSQPADDASPITGDTDASRPARSSA